MPRPAAISEIGKFRLFLAFLPPNGVSRADVGIEIAGLACHRCPIEAARDRLAIEAIARAGLAASSTTIGRPSWVEGSTNSDALR